MKRQTFTRTTRFLSCLVLLLTACGRSNDTYDANGVFETTEVVVSAEGTGKLIAFDVEEGRLIEAQNRVGQIDSIQLYLKKRQLEASLKAINSRRPDVRKQLAALEQQLATAKYERKRVQNLVNAEASTTKQLDDINAQIAVLEKQVDASQSTLETTVEGLTGDEQALALQIDQVNDQLEKCRINSPIDGTVLATYVEAGEFTTTGKPLFKVGNLDQMILRAYVTSDQLSTLKLGQQLTVQVDAGKKSQSYTGTLGWIAANAEFTPKTIQTRDERANLVYAVKIAVKNDGKLKIGMYGGVTF